MERGEGVTLIGRDFNFILDQDLNTTASCVSQTIKDMNKFKTILDKNQLIDIWRALHPIDSDYTFHSKVHGTYHRLNLFFINQKGVCLV